MKLILLILLISLSSFLYCQDSTKIYNNQKLPFGYSTITIGGIELFSASLGKYLNPDFSIAIKWSLFGVNSGEGGDTPASIGIGGNYYLKRILIFNYLSNDYLIIYGNGFKGYGAELTIGNTNKQTGLNFIYELGIGYSKAKYAHESKILVAPIIKIGLNVNL